MLVDQENSLPFQSFKTQRQSKEIIVLDRNNTFDIWQDIKNTVTVASQTYNFTNYKTVLMLPL